MFVDEMSALDWVLLLLCEHNDGVISLTIVVAVPSISASFHVLIHLTSTE